MSIRREKFSIPLPETLLENKIMYLPNINSFKNVYDIEIGLRKRIFFEQMTCRSFVQG